MTNLVFFGAGASKPFGIPTMQEMVIGFEKTLENTDPDLFGFYSRIKDTLIKEYGDSEIDIESMLSVISGIAANSKPTELGHFVFYYLSDNCTHKEFSFDEIELGKKLQEKLQNYIEKTCKINMLQDDINKAYCRSYQPLFKHMNKAKEQQDVVQAGAWKAYTTNYDNIFEGFCKEYKLPEEHFKQIDDSDNYYFNTKPLSEQQTFCKLHGSLDWTKESKSRKIIRKIHSGFERNKTEGRIMLFPIQQKDLYLHPWFTLFQDLKLGLSQKKTWYVIGYAFNDEFIKNAFEESLVEDSEKKLIMINPEAEQIKNKFSESIREQIDILPIKFGDEFFELQFEDYINKVKTIVVRFVTKNDLGKIKENQIAIQSNYNIQSAKILNDEVDVNIMNSNTHNGIIDDEIKKQVFFLINNPKDMEVKMELKIDYKYGDTIELYISDNTEKLNFDMDYGKRKIASSNDVKDYEIKGNTIWMQNPIKLDKTKLYHCD